MHVLSESITRILVSGFYTVEELQSRDESNPPHMNSVVSCFWVVVLRWLTLICFERIYWRHNHPSLRCVEKNVLKYPVQAEIIHSVRDLLAVVLKLLCNLTAQFFFSFFSLYFLSFYAFSSFSSSSLGFCFPSIIISLPQLLNIDGGEGQRKQAFYSVVENISFTWEFHVLCQLLLWQLILFPWFQVLEPFRPHSFFPPLVMFTS